MWVQSGGLRGISQDPTRLCENGRSGTRAWHELGKIGNLLTRAKKAWGGRGSIRFNQKTNHDPRGGPPHHPLSSWERTSPRFAPTLFLYIVFACHEAVCH